ncbi:MAG: M23 family metallopeptidase [Pseudomonadota bacterium]
MHHHDAQTAAAPRGLVWFGRDGARFVSARATTLAGAALCVGAVALGLLGWTAYGAVQDDLLGASLARQAQMKRAYEDRIAALRTKVDIVTSRQLLDQQALENRIAKLVAKQQQIGARAVHVADAINRTGGKLPTVVRPPVVKAKPTLGATGLRLGGLVGSQSPFSAPTRAEPNIIAEVETSLAETERQQLADVQAMQNRAARKARQLASILKNQGVSVTGTGGPLIELKGAGDFMESVEALDATLETLEDVRKAALFLPHGSPAPGRQVSSHFGTRRDPFTKRSAMHGGMDFRAPRGARVVATASGTVTKAGRAGGYGKLVEIDHGGGITTRYAHLSRIKVKKGQRVTRGVLIGKVGSTGRSTGPHLHYEVRRRGMVLNPSRFVKLETALKPLLR